MFINIVVNFLYVGKRVLKGGLKYPKFGKFFELICSIIFFPTLFARVFFSILSRSGSENALPMGIPPKMA